MKICRNFSSSQFYLFREKITYTIEALNEKYLFLLNALFVYKKVLKSEPQLDIIFSNPKGFPGHHIYVYELSKSNFHYFHLRVAFQYVCHI